MPPHFAPVDERTVSDAEHGVATRSSPTSKAEERPRRSAGNLATETDRAPGPEQKAIDSLLASRYFAKAPLLSAFLVYVCYQALEEGATRVSEQEIGVYVFRRPADYDCTSDNIVRNYARQLRKRMEDYYEHEGRHDPLLIEIPHGGYMPRFLAREGAPGDTQEGSVQSAPAFSPVTTPPPAGFLSNLPRAGRLLLAAILFLPPLFLSGFWGLRRAHKKETDTQRLLWAQLFSSSVDTILVPGDTSFVLYEKLKGEVLPLEGYENWLSHPTPGPSFYEYLRQFRNTSFLDVRIASGLERLPEVVPSRFHIQSPQNITMDDLRNSNAILVGSVESIPWIEVFQSHLQFRFQYDVAEERGVIVNERPQPGEAPVYKSSLDQFSQKTYAVIAFLPNLNKTGHVLLIQGIDVSATEAAADLLLQPEALNAALRAVVRPDGTLPGFEIMLETTILDSHPTNIHVISSRVDPS